MGCKQSSEYDKIYNDDQMREWKGQFQALKLSSKHVFQLKEIYNAIDQDRSGSIDLWEMLEHLNLHRSKFTKRIFTIMDEDGSGEIDFREFVVAMWNYCTLGKAALILFAFDLYDNDNSGKIDISEIQLMLKEVYGKDQKDSQQARNVMTQLQKYGKGEEEIDKEAFSEFVRRNPALLYPAFQLQQQLQKKVMGLGFWEDLAQARVNISDGVNMSVAALIQTHLNEKAFDQLVSIEDPAAARAHEMDSLQRKKERESRRSDDGAVAKNASEAYRDFQEHEIVGVTGTVADRRMRQGVDAVIAANKFKKSQNKNKQQRRASTGEVPRNLGGGAANMGHLNTKRGSVSGLSGNPVTDSQKLQELKEKHSRKYGGSAQVGP